MTTVSISQPTYLPYLGFFDKIIQSDVFVYFDDVEISIRSFHNRNKIKTNDGMKWLSVPLHHPYKQNIKDVIISHDSQWTVKHKNLIKANFEKAKFFDKYWKDVENILDKPWKKLIDINLEFINYFNSILDLNKEIHKSSEFNLSLSGSEKLMEICSKLDADIYLSGILGKSYLDEKIFQSKNITVKYQNFLHPTYNQLFGKFIPNLCFLDLLFNEGENSKDILKIH